MVYYLSALFMSASKEIIIPNLIRRSFDYSEDSLKSLETFFSFILPNEHPGMYS